MRFTTLNSDKLVWININKYKVDWDGKSASKIQFCVKQFFKKYWLACVVAEEMRIPGSRLRLDLVNINYRLIIETSPESVHAAFNPFFHKTRTGYLNSIKRDLKKAEWCERNHFKLIEVLENDPLTREFFIEKYNVYL